MVQNEHDGRYMHLLTLCKHALNVSRAPAAALATSLCLPRSPILYSTSVCILMIISDAKKNRNKNKNKNDNNDNYDNYDSNDNNDNTDNNI